MKEYLIKLFTGKKIAILGFGLEGRSTYRLYRSILPCEQITIIDRRDDLPADPELVSDPYVDLIHGDDIFEQLSGFDYLIKAPGVPGKMLPPTVDPAKVTSQTSLFLQFYSSQVIGITGTKGKSTTASLVHSILQHSGYHSLLVGNIGLPPFEAIPDIRENSVIVMELSSHQLEFLERSPHIAILLNIFQEHLDHYESYEHYQQAKLNITKFQAEGDYFIYSEENPILHAFALNQPHGRQIFLPFAFTPSAGDCIYRNDQDILMRLNNQERTIFRLTGGYHLQGEHNLMNIMAASAACSLAGVPLQGINEAIAAFKGLEHRIELVGEYEGIIFYNDSIATIPEATIQAVKTLKNVDTLILGGFDRGIGYEGLYPFLRDSGVQNFIMIGDAGNRMADEMNTAGIQLPAVFRATNYQEVVSIAYRVTRPGKICLLSPAASSYDMFKNFEHRGAIYKKNVRDHAIASHQ